MSLPPVRSTANLQQGRHSLLPLGRAAPAPASPRPARSSAASARPLPSAPPALPEFALPARTRPTPPGPRLWVPRGSGVPRQTQTSRTGAATPTETATHGAAGREGRGAVAGPHSRLRCPLRGSKAQRQEAAPNLGPRPGPGDAPSGLGGLNSLSTRRTSYDPQVCSGGVGHPASQRVGEGVLSWKHY